MEKEVSGMADERSDRTENEQTHRAGTETGSRTGEAGRDIGEASRDTVRDLRLRAEDRTNRWTDSLGEEIASVAHAFRDAGETLDSEGKEGIAGWTRAGADRVERLGSYLREEDPVEMIDDLTGLARSNPMLFVGTSFVGGLLLGRFFRSSEPEDRDRQTVQQARSTSREETR